MVLAIKELSEKKFRTGNAISYAEEEGRVNFLTTLLEVLILALRKSANDSLEIRELLFQPFEAICSILMVSDNPIPVVKSSVCIKSYLLYFYSEVVSRGLSEKVYALLERLLDPKEVEILSYYVGNILMILFDKVPFLYPDAEERGPQRASPQPGGQVVQVHSAFYCARNRSSLLAVLHEQFRGYGGVPAGADGQRHKSGHQDRDGPVAASPAAFHRAPDEELHLRGADGDIRFSARCVQRPVGAWVRPVPHQRLPGGLRAAEDPVHVDPVLPQREEGLLQGHGGRPARGEVQTEHAGGRAAGHVRRRRDGRGGRRRGGVRGRTGRVRGDGRRRG